MKNTPPAYVLDHVGLAVTDLVASREFYEQALAPLGFAPVVELENPPVIAFGLPTMPQFWIHRGKPTADVHVAFRAEDRERVDTFHEAGMGAGGRDNGAPGLRSHYHPGYYAAYLLDPERSGVLVIRSQDSAKVNPSGRPNVSQVTIPAAPQSGSVTCGYDTGKFLVAASFFSVAARRRDRQSSTGRLIRIRLDQGGRDPQPAGSSP